MITDVDIKLEEGVELPKYATDGSAGFDLKVHSFKKTFVELGIDEERIPKSFEDDYVKICPTKTNLFTHVHEVLAYLSPKYDLHLISNGFKESTEYKLKNTNIGGYFKNIIISEVVGVNNPVKVIFNYALGLANGQILESVMIGDSIEADIRGALSLGMDAVYFIPITLEIPEDIKLHISDLSELKFMF